MAPGDSRPCRSPCQNLPPIDPVEDELARDLDLVGGLHLSSTSPTPSCKPNLGPKLVPALIPTPVSAPTPPSSNKLFKQFMRAYLESNQGPRQPPVERKQSFKAKIPEMYYGKSHIDCYHFCQHCKDHFETAGATGIN